MLRQWVERLIDRKRDGRDAASRAEGNWYCVPRFWYCVPRFCCLISVLALSGCICADDTCQPKTDVVVKMCGEKLCFDIPEWTKHDRYQLVYIDVSKRDVRDLSGYLWDASGNGIKYNGGNVPIIYGDKSCWDHFEIQPISIVDGEYRVHGRVRFFDGDEYSNAEYFGSFTVTNGRVATGSKVGE